MPDIPNLVQETPRQFHLRSRLKSFQYAFRGVALMLRTQHNAWIHAAITLLVCTAGILLELPAADWCWIVLAIMAVWMAEALNTALEILADVASPEFHPLVRDAKDVAAGAVLIAALGAAIIGATIFLPIVLRRLG